MNQTLATTDIPADLDAVLSEAWSFCDVDQVNDVGGDRWQSEQSCGTAAAVVGAPFFQMTASCFIAGDGGVRAVSVDPTKPLGTDVAWQSRQVAGCARFRAWKLLCCLATQVAGRSWRPTRPRPSTHT